MCEKVETQNCSLVTGIAWIGNLFDNLFEEHALYFNMTCYSSASEEVTLKNIFINRMIGL